MRQLRWFPVLFLAALLALAPASPGLTAAPSAAQDEKEAHILVLHSYHPSFIWTREMESGLLAVLRDSDVPIHVSVEFLDQKNFPEPEIQRMILNSVGEKYKNRAIDVVVTTDNYATEQAVKLRGALFPQAPIVFGGYNGYREGQFGAAGRVAGVVGHLDAAGTVELAKTLLPDTNRVVVLHDDTESGRAALDDIRAAEAAWRGRIQFEYWGNRTYAEILREAAQLPRGAVLLFGVLTRDKAGEVIEMRDFAKTVSEAASVPLFQVYQMNYGTGSLGGALLSGQRQGEQVGRLALELLAGEAPDKLGVVHEQAAEKRVDFRQLERFSIPLTRVPAGVAVDFRPASFFEEHRGLVLATLGIVAALLAIIQVLALNVRRRQRAEAALRSLNNGLEQRVAARTHELAMANQELEAFSYSVSHDLRAPLRSIDGFSQILLEDYEAVLDDTGRDYLARIRAASRRMGDLIDDILRLSRVSRSEFEKTNVDMSELASEVLTELLETDRERAVVYELAPGLVCEGDRQLLRIALVNLFGNALKYSAPRAETRLQFGALQRADGKVYYVRDNGVGFDMAYAGKLFGAFQRLHAEAAFAGSGIGLAIVDRIVKKHGGRIWAESEPDQGATFFFTLGA